MGHVGDNARAHGNIKRLIPPAPKKKTGRGAGALTWIWSILRLVRLLNFAVSANVLLTGLIMRNSDYLP